MAHQPIRVVIADDHPVVLDGLATLLNSTPSIAVVGIAQSFRVLLDLLDRIITDIVILDLSGMGGPPLTVVNRIQRDHPTIKIIVFSSSVDLAPELLQAGVSGYIPKEDFTEQLITAIQTLAAGQTYLSPSVSRYLAQTAQAHRRHRLAPKELSVLKLLSAGHGTAEIAEQLQIDQRSVQNYITTLRRKIGCHERTQLADWYHRMYGPPRYLERLLPTTDDSCESA
jgi:DNA-binding NarL/FixJ family response regulator